MSSDSGVRMPGEGLRVRRAAAADRDAWNAFVGTHPQGSFFHRFEWQEILHEALGHRAHFLIAEADTSIVGVMPLVEMRSRLFGHSLSSMPFATYAGALGTTTDAQAALETHAIALAREFGVGALELRLRERSEGTRPVKLLYETFSKPIAADPEANMKAIRSKQRNIIRKGIKGGLRSAETDFATFYRIYSESVRNLGTPVFSPDLFRAIHRSFPDDTEFFAVFDGVQAVSASMNFYHRGVICPYYWGGLYAARRLAANDFLAWELINRAGSRGCSLFDFGRSKKGTGAHQWKLNLGFEASPLYYEYELIGARAIPEVNPNNPKYRVFIALWKKLPLPVSQWLGRQLSGSLG